MELELVEQFDKYRSKIREALGDKEHHSYGALLKIALENMIDEDDPYGDPDPNNIHTIDDGDYQGTQLFVVPERCYQPYTYWVFKVYYGSCSGCDTLHGINDDTPRDDDWNELPTSDQQRDDYMTLILHMIQSAKRI